MVKYFPLLTHPITSINNFFIKEGYIVLFNQFAVIFNVGFLKKIIFSLVSSSADSHPPARSPSLQIHSYKANIQLLILPHRAS